jgi:hypothetical protein
MKLQDELTAQDGATQEILGSCKQQPGAGRLRQDLGGPACSTGEGAGRAVSKCAAVPLEKLRGTTRFRGAAEKTGGGVVEPGGGWRRR